MLDIEVDIVGVGLVEKVELVATFAVELVATFVVELVTGGVVVGLTVAEPFASFCTAKPTETLGTHTLNTVLVGQIFDKFTWNADNDGQCSHTN